MLQKAHKRKLEEDKDTEFAFGGMRWSAERAEATAKRHKRQEGSSPVIGWSRTQVATTHIINLL